MKLKSILYKWMMPCNGEEYGNELWCLREKALSSHGWKCYIARRIYSSKIKKAGSFLPLNSEFANQPVFPHGITGVFISQGSRIGENCVIFQQVTIGSNSIQGSKHNGSPIIGNNVFIGAGAKIIGGIQIGNNVRIGANCVVTQDIPDNCTVVSQPARIIVKETVMDNHFRRYDSQIDNI